MAGEYSLSQSFGGLRVTNGTPSPNSAAIVTDHTANAHAGTSPPSPVSPSPVAPISQPETPTSDPKASRRSSIFNILRRNISDNDQSQSASSPQGRPKPTRSPSNRNSPDPLARTAAAKAYQSSMPMSHQAQQDALFPPYQTNPMQAGNRGPAMGAQRPVSGLYSAQPPPNINRERGPGSYRLRSESSRSSVAGAPSRTESKDAGSIMAAGVDMSDDKHRERSYSQSQPLAHNAPIPRRRSSKGHAAAYMSNHPTGQTQAPMNISSTPVLEGSILPSSEEWKERGAAVGVRQEIDANGKPVLRSVKKGVRDFAFGRTLGEGSYSTVLAATDRQTLREYAVKVLDKRHIIKEKKIKYVNIEKNTLNRLTEHPGIVRLYYTFQDEKSLYYVLDVASGGELLGVLKKIGTFDEDCTRFYGAQILDAIDYMHSRGVIHRDLKPENVLLDDQMHVKITDFGTAKLLRDPKAATSPNTARGALDLQQEIEDNRATSFVGTAEYVSPELLTDKNACKASDLWAFGCIIYQLLSGRPPFKAGNEYQTFQKIVNLNYEFPQGFPPAAKDLVERLLVLDPQRRLSIEHIKNHEFFSGMRWGRELWRMKAPRLKPYIPPTNVINLNGYPSSTQNTVASSTNNKQSTARPPPRIITELPPPTQLDIEWSPVLTRNNERILKLGNLLVLSTPMPNSPNSKSIEENGHKKLSRFFGGSTTKKRERLVMVTSSGRIIMAAAGGDEKKAKTEISLLASDCAWRIQLDAKGKSVWCVDTRGTQFVFEDTKSSSSSDSSRSSPEEWLDCVEQAKDFAISQSMLGSYTSDGGSDFPSPSSTIGASNVYPEGYNTNDRSGRNHLTKSQASLAGDDQARRHRFSKRQSKNGLGAAVF